MPEITMVVDKFRFFGAYDSFVRFFRGESDKKFSGLELIDKFSKFVDNLTDVDVIRLLVYFYRKHPVEGVSQDVLRMGAKRAIQTRFYKYLYGKEMPPSIIDIDKIYCSKMGYIDVKVDEIISNGNPADDALLAPITEQFAQEPIIIKPEKKNRKTKFSKKVKLMSTDELYDWAAELGISQEAIDKSKNKSRGLAKMYISNIIAVVLRKNAQLDWFSFEE